MVGEGGAALSGGQKARIALARAVYQNLDMYLMDEPFSALDVNVADHIHNHVLCKVLAGKTRIVCTHQHRYLRNADLVIRLDQGKVVAVGRPEEVLQSNGDSNTTSQVISNTNDSDADEKSKHKMSTHTESQSLEEESVVDSQFQEERGIGYVPISVYFKYGRSIGPILCAAIAISFAAMQITRSFADLWLSVWVNALTDLNVNQQYYVRVLALIVVINSVLAVVRAFLYAYGNLVAAERWHRRLLDSVLNTKLSFFDQRPFGQLINRFSSDTYQVDEQLPFTLNLFLTMLVSLLASVAVATASIWPLLFVFILLTFPYLTIQRIYRAASSDLKRICSITLSPVYSILSETLNGLTTIRCFRAEKRYHSFLDFPFIHF